MVLTNAAGGVGEGLSPGDLVVIRDHINLTGRTPLLGRNDERLGLRFPDMTEVYTVGLRERLEETAAGLGEQLGSGVYAWLLGPAYETPAEVEMQRGVSAPTWWGCQRCPRPSRSSHGGQGGRDLAGDQLAAGISATPLSHDEVQETATAARGGSARCSTPPSPFSSPDLRYPSTWSRPTATPSDRPHAGWTEPRLGERRGGALWVTENSSPLLEKATS